MNLGKLITALRLAAGELEQPSARASRGATTRTVTTTTADVAAAGNAQGTPFEVGGDLLWLNVSSSAGCVLEVCLDAPRGTSSDNWTRMVPGSTLRRSDGYPFGGFRVRLAPGTPASASLAAVFDVDPEGLTGSVTHAGRFPQLSPYGTAYALMRALTLAGAEVDLRAADEGALAVASWDGNAYQRMRSAALGDTDANALAALVTGARGQVYNRDAGSWTRMTAQVPGDSTTDSVRTQAVQVVQGRLSGWDGGNGWYRLRVDTNPNDGETIANVTRLRTTALMFGCNGGSFDRLRTVTPADGLAPTVGTLDVFARLAGWDGTQWARAQLNPGSCVGAFRAVDATARVSANAAVTVGTAQTQVAAANASRKRAILKALSTNTNPVYVGATGVTTANGMELLPGESLEWTSDDVAYAIVAAGTEEVRRLEETY